MAKNILRDHCRFNDGRAANVSGAFLLPSLLAASSAAADSRVPAGESLHHLSDDDGPVALHTCRMMALAASPPATQLRPPVHEQ